MKNDWIKKSLKQILKQNKGKVLMLVILIFFIVLASLVPPQILKQLIDHNLTPRKSDGLAELAAIYMGILVLIGVLSFAEEVLLTVTGQKLTKEIRIEMMGKLEKIHAGFFSSNSSGVIVSRFTNDVDAINTMFTSGIAGMAIDCFKIIGIVVSIWIFSSMLGILTLILIPAVFIITRLFQKRMLTAQIKNRILIGRVNNHISESIKNILMIKSFSKENYMENNYKKRLMENYQTIEKVNFYDSLYPPVIQITRAAVIALIVILSSKQLGFLGISLGMTAAAIDLISNLFTPIENLGMELQSIQEAVSGIRRVDDYFNEKQDDSKEQSLHAEEMIPDRRNLQMNFNHLSFYYEEDQDILQNINFEVKPQEKVTFVGRTGVGKSTLFKLIMGLLKPSEGSITINGIDVYTIPNNEKRKIFGYVDQNFPVIKGTVAEQISLKDPDIRREQIENALQFVGLKDYVETLADGMDTEVKNETLFSQGQKQMLAIARAIVSDPPILLLDEITANLDSITEEKIGSVLQKASAGHTILSISHRLSSMIACDTIVILENGKIKNAGSPEELLQNDEWYRSHITLEKLTWGS